MSSFQRNFSALRGILFFAAALSAPAFVCAATTPPATIPMSGVASSSAEPAAVAPSAPADLHLVLEQVQSLIHTQSQQLETQRLQIERQQREIDELRAKLLGGQPATSALAPGAAMTERDLASAATADALALRAATASPAPLPSSASASGLVNPAAQLPQPAPEGPLGIRLGRVLLTPGGWVDLTAIYRTTDVGSGLGTSFASIPYSNTVAGGLSETRFTAQSSRISFRADEDFGKTKVFGYAEADFNGYLPSNAYVSTNSDSLRMRVYFLNLARDHWEVLGGQSWSLLTPNRVGVSPFLNEIYNTVHLDTNYQVGLTYARQAQLRTVYHFNDSTVLALSLENPEQFTGSAATLPALFSTSETDVNSSTGSGGGTATPNLFPDVIAKLASDPTWGERRWHLEATGLLTSATIDTPESITKTAASKDSRIGGGVSAAANLELAKGLHFIGSGFWSDGGGRYIGGLGPSFVVAQGATTKSPFDVQLIHSGSATAAAEWQANERNLLSFTYSGAYFGRASSIDPSTGNLVGYGYIGSPSSNNRAIQEGTIASQTTLWKHPSFGAIQMISQSSYITRAPWYLAKGAPKDAHVVAEFLNLRYVLP